MVTYVNDLRLSELATGEGSGTWGTTTNTNLELIGEALGYATEAITTNADTHATTVADGSTDPGRAMYIKYTGTLDSACTITIGPNTLSRVHIIENATSGSQSIIIKQGSGAEITIPNGYVKVVYLDGAGSGAAVTEAFDNLSVGTNFRVGNGAAEDTAIVFDGNAQDFYIGLDDSADDFMIGLGSTVGTTPIISVTDNKDVAIPDGTLTITTGNNEAQLILKSTDADVNSGPQLALTRDSGSPADDDFTGLISFNADDDGGNETRFGLIRTQIKDASDGSEDGLLDIKTMVAGTERSRLVFEPTETVINQDSVDIDTRIESNGNANMIFVDAGNDAVSIGHGSTIAIAGERHELQVYDTNFSLISAATFRNGSDGANLTLAHSRSGTIGTQTILQDGDTMGGINFMGSDGTDMASYGARIFCEVDGTPGSNDMPGRLIFATTSDGGTGSTERFRISAGGTATFQHPVVVQSGATQGYYIENNAGNATTPRITNDANDHTVIRPGKSSGAVQFNNFANDAELMRLADDGKLGVGVSDGGGLPLHIAVSSGDCKLRMETAAKDAFTMELDNSTGALKLGSAATAGAIVIEQDGQVGIGTALPGAALQVDADSGSEDILTLNNEKSGSDSGVVTQFRREGTGTGFIANTSSATSYATSQSDRRAKKNFEDWTESVLTHFKDLKPTKFHFIQEDDSSEKNKGYIAQDLVGSFPEAYPTKNDGEDADRYFFNPGGMVVYLMKAIQEQQVLIETLQTEVSALKGA